MTIKTKYNIGDIVFLRTDINQDARLISGIIIRYSRPIYCLSCGTTETHHYEFEFSKTKDILLSLGVESKPQPHE